MQEIIIDGRISLSNGQSNVVVDLSTRHNSPFRRELPLSEESIKSFFSRI